MRTFLMSFFGALVALLLFTLGAIGIVGGMIASAGREPPRPDAMVIGIDLRNPLPDNPPSGGLAGLSGEIGFTDVILRLSAAADDPTVKGVLVRASDFGIGSARAEELRDAFRRLRAAGKFVMVHSQGSLLAGPSAFRAISAADEIWLQPGSELSVPGVSFESVFLGEAMKKLAVEPEFVQLYEYKSAVETFTATGYSDASREAMQALADRVWEVSLADIAADRNLDVETVRALLESSPIGDRDALAAGLVDKLGWPEDAEDAAKEKAGDKDMEIVDISAYRMPALEPDAPYIALVGAEGDVITGAGGGGPFDPEPSFASDRLAGAILAAARDERVKAIIFRIDSGGGSPAAADQIWRAVERAQEMGKPVVVSMGPVAASAAYYVAAGADYIYASDTTITGSIGVFGGKFAIDAGMAKLGVRFDEVGRGGDFADAFGADAFTPGQYEAFETALVRTYDRFVSLVAKGRDLSENAVRAIARGRVWSGIDARENGLVDARGGLVEAIGKARELGGIADQPYPRIQRFPEPRSGIEVLQGVIGADAGTPALASDREVQLLLQELARAQAMRDGAIQARGVSVIER